MTDNQKSTQEAKEQNKLIIDGLAVIQQQNVELLEKVNNTNKQTIKTAVIAGAASGGIVAIGIEFIRIKMGI